MPFRSGPAATDRPAPYQERFGGRVGPRWRRAATGGGELTLTEGGLRLSLLASTDDGLALAQLDEGPTPTRPTWSWRPPLHLTVRARWSAVASELVGTSGFGFWNDPWTAGGFDRPPAWLWFAHYSPPSHIALDPAGPGQGPRAAVLATPSVGRLGLWLGNLALRLPGVGRLALSAAERVVSAGDLALGHDLRAWHTYELDWQVGRVSFSIDGQPLGVVAAAPGGPLGFVAWMDNQWAALRPNGTATGGLLATDHHQWLELSEVSIQPTAPRSPRG